MSLFLLQEVGLTQEKVFSNEDSDIGGALDRIVGSVPGIDEAMAFSILLRTVSSMEFDLVVFDTAPTGHTLKLLSFPGVLSQFFGKLGPLTSIFGKVCSLHHRFTMIFILHVLFYS